MRGNLFLFPMLIACASVVAGQNLVKVELEAAGVFPVNGYVADDYSAGPGLRAGGEFRLHRFLAAEAGWTGAWMRGTECSRFGCEHPRYENRLLDYGVRGVLPLVQGQIELSAGVGGGYIWFDRAAYTPYYNSALLQYSAKASLAFHRGSRLRSEFSLRTWRDLGRPVQQWLAITTGISYGLGRVM